MLFCTPEGSAQWPFYHAFLSDISEPFLPWVSGFDHTLAQQFQSPFLHGIFKCPTLFFIALKASDTSTPFEQRRDA